MQCLLLSGSEVVEETLGLVDDAGDSRITDAMIGNLEEASSKTGFTHLGCDCFA